jgi:hypothetical protein
LLGMHERADLLNGTVLVESSPGAGTVVTASFPPRRRPTHVTAAAHPLRRTGTS